MLELRGISLAELSRRVDVSVVNLSVLKNNSGRAIRLQRSPDYAKNLSVPPGTCLKSRLNNVEALYRG